MRSVIIGRHFGDSITGHYGIGQHLCPNVLWHFILSELESSHYLLFWIVGKYQSPVHYYHPTYHSIPLSILCQLIPCPTVFLCRYTNINVLKS